MLPRKEETKRFCRNCFNIAGYLLPAMATTPAFSLRMADASVRHARCLMEVSIVG
jgi:hypothetical protein